MISNTDWQNTRSIFHHPDFKQKNQAVPYRLVAFDLDRTILRNDGNLSPATRSVLQTLVERKIHIVIASGRPYTSLPQELLDFPEIEYAITSNGAALIRIHPFEYIDQLFIPAQQLQKLVHSYAALYPLEVFISGQGYASREYVESPTSFGANEEHINYVQSTRIPVENMPEFIFRHQDEIESMDILVPSAQINQEIRQILCPKYPELHITSSNDHMIEISHGNAGKGNRLIHLLQLLHLSPEECITFGDGDNDADMLRISGLGIAMENASEAAKKAAACITLSNENDGVAAALRLIFIT